MNPKLAPNESETITIEFEKGIPVGLNGEKIPAVELVRKLNTLGGKHGVGRMDVIENRVVGIKSREVYEAPGAVILYAAHNELEKLTMDKETFRFKQGVSDKVANLIYDGLWFSPLFDSLMAFVDQTQVRVTGSVTVELYKGNVTILSRESVYSLYNKELATYTVADKFDHSAAEGFLALYGLPYKTMTKVARAAAHTITI